MKRFKILSSIFSGRSVWMSVDETLLYLTWSAVGNLHGHVREKDQQVICEVVV